MGHPGPASLVFALIPILAAAGVAARGSEDPHSRCDHCHVEDAEAPALPDARCCFNCHLEIEAGSRQTGGGSRHLSAVIGEAPGLVTAGRVDARASVDCLSCHRPHPDGTRCRLRIDESSARVSDTELDPSSLLCLECHEAFLQTEPQADGNYTLHPVGIAAPRMVEGGPGAPVLPLADIHGTADPGDDVIACTTCHFQHESPNPDLLRWGEEELVAACTLCHWNGGEAPAENLLAAGRSSQ